MPPKRPPDNPRSSGDKLPETKKDVRSDSSPILADRCTHEKTRGDLRETLDPLLTPRTPQKKAGRPKGSQNYPWSPAADAILVEIANEYEPGKAKHVMFHRLEPFHGNAARINPDAYRKAVEHRLAKLGLPTCESRRAEGERHMRPWTEAQMKALLGSLGENVSLDTIAKRTGRSVDAVRAKMARLGYTVADIPGLTTDELTSILGVTPRQIRRWKENRQLETKNRRVTEASLQTFLKEHPDRIDFDKLSYEAKVYLADLGYQNERLTNIRKTATEILSGLGRDRKSDNPRSETAPLKNQLEEISSPHNEGDEKRSRPTARKAVSNKG